MERSSLASENDPSARLTPVGLDVTIFGGVNCVCAKAFSGNAKNVEHANAEKEYNAVLTVVDRSGRRRAKRLDISPLLDSLVMYEIVPG